MREFRTSGSVRGALSNERPYRDYKPHKFRRMLPGESWRRVTSPPAPNGRRAGARPAWGGARRGSQARGRGPPRAVADLLAFLSLAVVRPAALRSRHRPPARRERPPAAALAQAFTLTAAEARLAAGLAAGATRRDYAKAAGIAYETARWHLKRIYDKTETRALLLRTKATLGAGESP
jgi:DNA-binding CsgD family transcriptional regulator